MCEAGDARALRIAIVVIHFEHNGSSNQCSRDHSLDSNVHWCSLMADSAYW